jgi:uncharacterized membrane protein
VKTKIKKMSLSSVLILFGISALFIAGGIAYTKISSKNLKKKYKIKEENKNE